MFKYEHSDKGTGEFIEFQERQIKLYNSIMNGGKKLHKLLKHLCFTSLEVCQNMLNSHVKVFKYS